MGLELANPATRRFDWSTIGAESEAHAVWLLEDTTEPERRLIEEDWTRWIAIVIRHGEGLPYRELRRQAREDHGMPGWFFDRHAPAIRKQIEAERGLWSNLGMRWEAAYPR
jgi:hypothetical protein